MNAWPRVNGTYVRTYVCTYGLVQCEVSREARGWTMRVKMAKGYASTGQTRTGREVGLIDGLIRHELHGLPNRTVATAEANARAKPCIADMNNIANLQRIRTTFPLAKEGENE